jgi:tetratricopeptide (TPR) repeat protein
MGYRAYISYSHGDERFAAWLQRRIESYRLPNTVAKTLGYRNLSPLFRDRSDLRSGADLSNSLREALAESEALIVVCSNQAAVSRWVDEEIETFRELHGDERIFAIIARDDPPDCFPPALLHDHADHAIEPIAADARRGFDGSGDARLKTIAALLDIDFDLFKRRDLRRQVQRRTAALAATAAIATITLMLAVTAIDARNEAERRRTQAEGLIGFMLGDLRSRLEPIGRLDVLDAVGDEAMEYFAALEEDELTGQARLRSAQALRQIGEVRMSQGDLNQAFDAFSASNEQAASLLGQADDLAAIEFELGQSHFWIGYVHYERHEVDSARRHFETYLRLSESLTERAPDSPKYQTELAYARSNLGTLELAEHHVEVAEQHFRRSAEMHQALLEATPDDPDRKDHLAAAWSWLGAVASESGDVRTAIEWYTREHQLRKDIIDEVDDWYLVGQAANSANLLGRQQLLALELTAASSTFDELADYCGRLVKHDPSNAAWRSLLGFSHIGQATLLTVQDRLDDARKHADQAVSQLEPLVHAAPESVSRLEDLLSALSQQARVARANDDVAEARKIVADGLTRLKAAQAEEQSLPLTAAGLYLLDGDLHPDDASRAEQSWRTGLNLLVQRPTESREIRLTLIEIALLERTGDTERADQLWQEVSASGYGDRKTGPLTQALTVGIDTHTQQSRE